MSKTTCLEVSIVVVHTPAKTLERQYETKQTIIKRACAELQQVLQDSIPEDNSCTLITGAKMGSIPHDIPAH